MGGAESIINVNGTAARRVREQGSGEWRKATREHEARAPITTEEEDAQEGRMSFTEAWTLEDPLALEEMMRANTVEHKLNPKLPPGTPRSRGQNACMS